MLKNHQNAEATRNLILQAAIEIFFLEGYNNATLEKIAKQANVTRGAIYWYFKNKKDIFKALHEDLYKTMMQIVFENIDDSALLDSIERSCIQCLLSLAQNTTKKKALTVFFCKCDYSNMEDVLEIQKQKKLQNITYFTELFEKIELNLKDGVSPRNAALSLSCYLSGIVNEYLRNNLFDLAKEAESLVKQFFNSIINK